MNKSQNNNPAKYHKIPRRLFLSGTGLLSVPFVMKSLFPSEAKANPAGVRTGSLEEETAIPFNELNEVRESFWYEDGKYFIQHTVDTADVEKGVIRARVNGRWQSFMLREMDDAFVDWNFSKRLFMLDVMSGKKSLDMYNDIHNAAVASYGANRGDSDMTLNVAFKGTGWVPKREFIKDKINEYYSQNNASMMKKMSILKNNYNNKDLWQRNIFGSLELYTTQAYETHTFLNFMNNPIATLCFLDMNSYELRAIPYLIHPENPNLSEYEKDVLTWINYAHDFFHGGGEPLYASRIAVIYHMIEEFDNSPWGQTETAGGHRLVPRM
jgi:hypothetical protein